jgi:hypothetical protein
MSVDAVNLDTIYGSPLLEWPRIESRLERGVTQAPGTGGPGHHTCWLATINRDGSPRPRLAPHPSSILFTGYP